MIETLGAIAFIIAIILMCGPTAAYNAGSWIGLILKVFWKVAVWAFRTVAQAAARKQQATPVAALPVNITNAEPLARVQQDREEKFEGIIIEGKASVL